MKERIMNIFEDSTSELSAWIRREVELQEPVHNGSRGAVVRRVQEWLNLHELGVVIDGDFGTATNRAACEFQERAGASTTGEVDDETFALLVQPMVNVLCQRLDQSIEFGSAVVEYAQAHLLAHPREVGGSNRGPWVRLYMRGNEGTEFPWCAGFVTFLIDQAAQSLNVDKPIKGSSSCDALAAQGDDSGLFLEENVATPEIIPPGTIFLVRRVVGDWTHTGIVTEAYDGGFDTIEGNTNDSGDREGFEVCARMRTFAGKDFILPAMTGLLTR
jgi:hypothetical protein